MHEMWKDMFVITLPILEKILRPVIVYFFLVVMLRLSGKRELVQLNPFDLVVLLTLSNTVQNAIIGDDNSVSGGLLGATALLAINYLVVRFLYSHKKLDQVVEGKADVLIEAGRVRTQHLKGDLITMTQLEGRIRESKACERQWSRKPLRATAMPARPRSEPANQKNFFFVIKVNETRMSAISRRTSAPS